jgi:hypothetical protein
MVLEPLRQSYYLIAWKYLAVLRSVLKISRQMK